MWILQPKRIVLECLVLKDYKMQNYKRFLESDYVPRGKVNSMRYINFENIGEFVLNRQRYPLTRCNNLEKIISW